MRYGVCTSRFLEIAETARWTLVLFDRGDQSVMGAELYHSDAEWREPAPMDCQTGACVTTEQGLFWPLKRCTDHEIVLNGGGDAFVHRRDSQKSEYFQWSGSSRAC